jgi:hypothetical protein
MEARPNSPPSRSRRVLRPPAAAVAPNANVRMLGVGDTTSALSKEKGPWDYNRNGLICQ